MTINKLTRPGIALILAVSSLALVTTDATAQFTKFSKAEDAMHLCWTYTHRIKNARHRKGNAYRSLVSSRNNMCAKARKLAKQETAAGEPPFNGVAPDYPWRPGLYEKPSYEWFFK